MDDSVFLATSCAHCQVTENADFHNNLLNPLRPWEKLKKKKKTPVSISVLEYIHVREPQNDMDLDAETARSKDLRFALKKRLKSKVTLSGGKP